jgi:diguanylate cyclase (GGDEF)-like protein
MMIDIDHFKDYNDKHGHKVGDACLKTVADALTKSVTRVDDFVARYGGDEFSVVLPNTDEDGARMIAEKILENVRDSTMPQKGNKAALHITVSIGVVIGRVKHSHTPDDFIKRADKLLYKSKQNGRDRYSMFRI